MTIADSPDDAGRDRGAGDSRARRNVAVLVGAQGLLGAQMPMVFTVGGLAGSMVAPASRRCRSR
jgi:hypothetical protein